MPLYLYDVPAPGHLYCMGLDSSQGGGNDASVLVVLDAMTAPVVEVACLRSKVLNAYDLAQAAWVLHQYGYRVAKGSRYVLRSGGLVPEIVEEALADALKALFPYDYWYIQEKSATPQRQETRAVRFGFWTTERAKTTIITRLSRAIETQAVVINNPWLQDEAQYWTRLNGEWKYTLESGHVLGHGDVTMAWALALAGVEAVQEELETRRKRSLEFASGGEKNLVYADLSNSLGEREYAARAR